MRRDGVVGGVRSAGVGDRRTLIDIDRSHREREGCASLSFVPSFPLNQVARLSGRFRSLLWLPYTCSSARPFCSFHSINQLLPLFLLLLLLLLLLYYQGTFHVGSGPVESGKSAMGING